MGQEGFQNYSFLKLLVSFQSGFRSYVKRQNSGSML